tara:strand:- start:613 stop:837 length:225 start_codon:yes stop_codon:yes gene_type:complete
METKQLMYLCAGIIGGYILRNRMTAGQAKKVNEKVENTVNDIQNRLHDFLQDNMPGRTETEIIDHVEQITDPVE